MLKKERLIMLFCAFIAVYLFFHAKALTNSYKIDNATNVQKIVSLSPSNTEILFALGSGDRVVGTTTYCDYPPEAMEKYKIGSFNSPDIEKIIALQPDLVLANSTLQAQASLQLERVGIKVVKVQTESLEQMLSSIKIIAKTIGNVEQGELLLKKLDDYKLQAQNKIKSYNSGGKSVFIEVWDTPLLTVGNKSYLNDLIRQAGGKNVAIGVNKDYVAWNLEEIYFSSPDIYLRLRGNDMGSKADTLPQKLMQLPAVKNDNVVTLFGDWIVRPGPRSFAALPEIVDAIYEKGRK